ncbi:histone acetyltransferase [Galdieria sulphuraria]|uniref:histone acetyltransferase n=1 Tax=Galdieria sulphuraria TaxID=130081 RepID=M2XZD4_GALSU|nr:histone acetyltransferase [Galdieria sulphuraria]EME29013.1 histone acetyltransferase [Galdieria sulphuraria]|eukprot:XP_005705533.1 histone acetyltransferase [Galdieria sulphuraria]
MSQDNKEEPKEVPVNGNVPLTGEIPLDFRLTPCCEVPKAKRPRPVPEGAWEMSTEGILGPDSQHAYVQRWYSMVQQEKSGAVKFQVVRNDSKRESLILLLGLKNVFVRQLPNMPKPYVTRLVFDRKHESTILTKCTSSGEYVVMGGCCYRPFIEERFAEIAFLAISDSEQVRGYGTRLMSYTKERTKELGLTHILTCADNNAVPYFKKQGFSKTITLEKERWQGYIKDYDGVTLMECVLNPKVDYLNIPSMLKAQKMCLIEKLKEISNIHIVYPGLDPEARKRIRLEDIPGLKEGLEQSERSLGKTIPLESLAAPRDPASLQALHKELQHILTQVKQHQSAWPFLEPVDPEQTGALDYYDVIKNPIDLRTIQERLDRGDYYVTKEIFAADLKRMIENCEAYNGEKHFITELAHNLERFFNQKL